VLIVRRFIAVTYLSYRMNGQWLRRFRLRSGPK
jgi:hypothetical protein